METGNLTLKKISIDKCLFLDENAQFHLDFENQIDSNKTIKQ